MSVRTILPALMLLLFLSAPALAGQSADGQPIQPSGPVVSEDFCPG